MQHLAPFIVMIVLLIIIAVVILGLMNYRLKKQMIELSLFNEDLIQSLTGPGSKYEALKWGLILFFGGLGLIIIEYIPYESGKSPLPYGVEAVCIATGLLIYYFLLNHKKNKS